MSVKSIPEGFHSITPYLVADRVAPLLEFLKQAFGAEETERMQRPDGSVMHAQVRIGDSMLMMGEPMGGDHQPMPCALYLYVEDTDAVYQRALDAGATSISEPADQFYGDRHAGIKDPSGNLWWVATHLEDVSHDEMMRRAAARH